MQKEDGRSRKERALETKNHLCAVADRLFTQYGFDDVSVDKIVEEAGLSKGAFYVHFESKDSLLAALITEYVDKVDVDYQKFVETFSSDISATDIFLRLIEKIADVIVDTIGLERMKALYRTQLTNITYTGTAASYNRMLYTTIMDVLSKGIQRKEFASALPPEEMANHIILALRGLTYEWCIRYPDFNLKEQSLAHFRIVLQGIQVNCGF